MLLRPPPPPDLTEAHLRRPAARAASPAAPRSVTSLDVASGLFWSQDVENGPGVRIYLRRWADVLNENKRRLDFITTKLEHDPSTAESLDWVRNNYGDLLPDTLLAVSRATS